ncbi:unnamed protein product [Porites lobata]|uniref:Endonuclease/exonuclease/phosphatase domain-containing protein n=1 Tax=Porites lobata TaxID=104759 RepID=A0ABN8RWY4_9CNID|nr:unnamed protein product [Porites lobata]
MAESTGHLLISGDFNLHVDDPCSIYANLFNEILESCNLKEHVTGATHANGHTLDLVISKKDNPLITEIKIFDPVISNHCAFHCNLRVQKPHFTKKKVYYRNLRSLDIESFCEDILTSPLLQDQAVELNALVDHYYDPFWISMPLVTTSLLCDREQYVNQCYVVNNLTDIINEHSSYQRILF